MIPILHHYSSSPFGELVRIAMGVKGIEWASVRVPSIMPKPGQTALTGGYGKTPVLQIGADIYCDTAAIMDALEAHAPDPTLYPAPLGPLHRVVANWAGGAQFVAHVAAAMGDMPEGAIPQAFIDDRKARMGFDMQGLGKATPHLVTQVETAATWLDATLADGRAFIGGDAVGHGDLALFSNLWFVRSIPFAKPVTDRLFSRPALAGWFARITAFGHGRPVDMTPDAAIEIARAAEPAETARSVEGGFSAGQSVQVRTDGLFDTPVAGRLMRCDASGITVLRESERAGTVAVHLPRLGQTVVAE